MPINPSNMRVVDVARLLNSTSFGFVLPQARLYREFNRIGFRIGSSENPRNINLRESAQHQPPEIHCLDVRPETHTGGDVRRAQL